MRRRRALDARALRAEFQLERPAGIAAWRALVSSVGELEQARIDSHNAARRAQLSPLSAPRHR